MQKRYREFDGVRTAQRFSFPRSLFGLPESFVLRWYQREIYREIEWNDYTIFAELWGSTSTRENCDSSAFWPCAILLCSHSSLTINALYLISQRVLLVYWLTTCREEDEKEAEQCVLLRASNFESLSLDIGRNGNQMRNLWSHQESNLASMLRYEFG